MRYTKEVQSNVCKDIQFGLTPQQCSDKYGVPVSVIIRWNNLEMPAQRAAEIALRKYQSEVSGAEARIMDAFSECLDPDVSDEMLFRAEESLSRMLFRLVADVVSKERRLNPQRDKPSDAQVIIEITNRWKDNRFLRMYDIPAEEHIQPSPDGRR